MKHKQILALSIALLAPFGAVSAAEKKPVKVFILAGQSNMVGTGSITTFPAIGMDPETAPMLKLMQDAEGNPVVCDKVYITSAPNPGEEEGQHGKLEANYGAPKGGPKIGPEYTFGIYAHQMLGEPILIIKTAWGGKDLINQFRPPSAGEYKFTEAELATMKEAGADIEAAKAKRANAGEFYRMMIAHIQKTLKDPKAVYPDYDPAAGYEVAGFVWFQGYNDFIQGGKNSSYPPLTEDKSGPCDYSEYTRLLACFIRDIRKELNAPKMPFVTGVFGMEGKEASEKIKSFRKAQAATAELPEFKGNVVNVFTENYWSEKIAQLMQLQHERLKGKGTGKNKVFPELEGEAAKLRETIWEREKKAALSKAAKKKGEELPKDENAQSGKGAWREARELERKFNEACLSPEDAKLIEIGVSNQGYHYWGSAKFYAQAGKAFAEAVPGIQKTNP